MNVKVEFYSPSIVRIYKTPKDKPYVRESQVVVKTPEQVSVQYTNKGGNVLMKSAELQVEFNPLTGGVYFYDTHGKLLLKDKDYGTSFAHKDDAGTPAFQVRNAFLLEADEPIYGIGQVWDGKLNRRNSVHQMRNENTLTYSPYFMSPTKGYGVYWDNYSISEFADAPQELSFSSLGHCADYYFMFGKTPDGVIAEVRELTGKAPMLPLWAYGFSKAKTDTIHRTKTWVSSGNIASWVCLSTSLYRIGNTGRNTTRPTAPGTLRPSMPSVSLIPKMGRRHPQAERKTPYRELARLRTENATTPRVQREEDAY